LLVQSIFEWFCYLLAYYFLVDFCYHKLTSLL
jgi:hypothetical protein